MIEDNNNSTVSNDVNKVSCWPDCEPNKVLDLLKDCQSWKADARPVPKWIGFPKTYKNWESLSKLDK